MTDLNALTRAERDELRTQYETNGFVALPDQVLPPGVTPARTEIAFVRIDNTTEVYAAGTLQAPRDLAFWSETLPAGSVATLLLSEESGFDAALDRLLALLALRREEVVDRDAVLASLDTPPPTFDPAELEEALRAEIDGQAEALTELALRVATHLGRVERRRPLALMAVGPTGVGKTRTAEVLGEILQPHGYTYLRLDMAEYTEAHRVSQLFGAPQGYVGHGEPAVLVDTLRDHPRALVLFDEIEKAHPSIFLALMNALDAGRLSSPKAACGTFTVDCREAIFLFTSNLAADEITADATNGPDDHHLRQLLVEAGLRPELVGRLAAILRFGPLDRDAEITALARVVVRLAADYGFTLWRMEPGVLIGILTSSYRRGRSFGIRGTGHQIERVLAPVFLAARRNGLTGEVALLAGPPLEVVPVGTTAADAATAGGV